MLAGTLDQRMASGKQRLKRTTLEIARRGAGGNVGRGEEGDGIWALIGLDATGGP
jgi:hypothetical protein